MQSRGSGGVDLLSAEISRSERKLRCARTFLASATDTAISPLKRTGVLSFVGAANNQYVIPANTAALNTAYNVASSTVCFWMKANLPTGAGNSGAMLWDRRPNSTTPGIVMVQLDNGTLLLQSNNS